MNPDSCGSLSHSLGLLTIKNLGEFLHAGVGEGYSPAGYPGMAQNRHPELHTHLGTSQPVAAQFPTHQTLEFGLQLELNQVHFPSMMPNLYPKSSDYFYF